MKSKRQQIWDKTDGHCWYCGKPLVIGDFKQPESRVVIAQWFCIDHQIPKTQGGSNDIENLVPACWTCNGMKGHKTVEEYRLYLSMKEAGMPYFSAEQIAWLKKQNFRVKEVRPTTFWAERQGLDFVIYEREETTK